MAPVAKAPSAAALEEAGVAPVPPAPPAAPSSIRFPNHTGGVHEGISSSAADDVLESGGTIEDEEVAPPPVLSSFPWFVSDALVLRGKDIMEDCAVFSSAADAPVEIWESPEVASSPFALFESCRGGGSCGGAGEDSAGCRTMDGRVAIVQYHWIA